MKKRLLSIALVLCMLVSLLPAAAFADNAPIGGSCGKSVTWALKDGTLTISGTGEMAYYDGDNPAPWKKHGEEIKSVVVADGVTKVSGAMFDGLTAATAVSFGSKVSGLDGNMLGLAHALESITVSDKNASYCVKDGVLYSKSMTTLIRYPESKAGTAFTVPDGVKVIGSDAFSSCNKLTSLTLPTSVTTLERFSVYACENLKSIKLPSKLDSIGDFAFAYCTSLTEMTVPEGVKVLSADVFYDCSSLKTLRLPVSLAEIGSYCTVKCDKLTDVYYAGTQKQWKLVKVDSSNTSLTKAKMHYGNLTISTPTISITTSAGKPMISWTKIIGADKYWIYRSTDGKSFKYYDSTKNTSYKNSSTNIGTTYYYKVKAVTVSDGENVASGYSNVKSIQCKPAAPSLSIYRTNGKPQLKWKAVDGASKYWIYRSTNGGDYKYYDSTTKLSYTNNAAASGTVYFYKVKAVAVVNGKNVSSAFSGSKNLFTTLTAPIVKITTSAGRPMLRWDAVKSADRYWIYRSTDGKNFKYYDSTKNTSYKNSSTSIGTTYYYKVKAVCAVTSYANSAMSTAKSIKRVPAAPDLSLGLNANNKPLLSWGSVSGAAKYWIYRSTDGKNFKYYDSTTKTSYNNNGASLGVTYYYKIKAVAVVGKNNVTSAYSRSVSVTVPDPSKGGKCGDNIKWKITGDTLYISGSGKMYDYDNRDSSKNKVPWKKSFSKVVISDGVTSIGSCAFEGCESLSSVSIPASVKSIGERAFQFCMSLSSIVIPEGVETIGDSAFSAAEGLKRITLPSTLKSIGSAAFAQLIDLETITLPEGLETIGDSAFIGCDRLKTLTIPASVKNIGASICRGCKSFTGYIVSEANPYYCVVGGVLYTKDMTELLSCLPGVVSTVSFTVPDSVKVIGDEAFYGCAFSGSFTLPKDLEKIGSKAFSESTLVSFTAPASLKSVGDYAFSGCDSLRTVTFSGSLDSIGKEAFSGCTMLKSVTMPDKLGSLGDEAFHFCENLESIVISDGLKSIGFMTFAGCRNLASVTLPTTLQSIGKEAFSGCTHLKNFTLPAGLKTIGEGAFRSTCLTSIVIPDGVTAIPVLCFCDCRYLTSITIPTSVKSIGSSALLLDSNLKLTINYKGTKAQWSDIAIDRDNDSIDRATIVYNYK